VALILVLGVLAILALLATTFATLTAVDRRVSQNYADAVRARLVAESGVHAALALLQHRMLRGTLWTETSWSVADDRTIRVDGAELKDAGLQTESEFYRVRISDAHSRIHVNDGAAWGPDHSVSRNLRRILNVLGAQPSVNVSGLGDKILRSRPSTGYGSPFDLIVALDGDAAALERVRPFVTVRAWSDPDVCNPVPLSSETARLHAVDFPRPSGGGGPLYRVGHQKNFRGEPIAAPLLFFDPQNPDPAHARVWGRDSLVPRGIELVRRAPVNVNTAPREVLMALVTDLEGVLLVERRRDLLPSGRGAASSSPCASPGSAYGWTSLRYRYDGTQDDGSEIGELHRTRPFTGPGGRSANGIPASIVVDEILAYRKQHPFGAWAEFHRFIETLVERGLFEQAEGDVLKANFNPNLHLNELNPNRALFTHVDKTDLIVHSTEFCFTPMGMFDLESEGRVVRIVGDGDYESVATRTVFAFVKLFDAVRETSQAQFRRGEMSPRRSGPETNNNFGLESGPEPDNGKAPSEADYEGYLQLSTVGSNFMKNETKPKDALWTTLSDGSFYPGAATMAPGGAHLGSVIHAHFQLDHAAHHHASRNGMTSPPFWDGFRLPQGAWRTAFGSRGTLHRNWGDRTETIPSPYSPVDATRAGTADRYRLAWSFRGTPPAGIEAAPGDLRVDGAYVERDSAFGYWIDENVSFNFNEGAVAFWIKPAFSPGNTSKRRTLLSLSRYHATRPEFMNPSPFGLYFVPPHGGDDSLPPSYLGGLARFRPSSLAFGFGFSAATGYSWEMGSGEDKATDHAFVFTPTMKDVFQAHEWTHLAVTWDNPRGELPTADTVKIYVNGRVLPGTAGMTHLFAQEGQPFQNTPWWSVHSLQMQLPGAKKAGWVKNTIRLGGEPSKFFDLPGEAGLFPANYTADSTFDEFYVWMDRGGWFNGGLWGIQQLWNRGRYYRPDDREPSDATFTSGPIELGAPRRLLGVAWTELAEDYDASLKPKTLDHSTMPPTELKPEESSVDLGVEVAGIPYGPYRNPAFSPVGRPIAVDGPVRYTAKLKIGVGKNRSPILLSTPVLDDVTLYFDCGGPKILGWVSP